MSENYKITKKALNEIKEVSIFINEKKKEADTISRIIKLQTKFNKLGSKVENFNYLFIYYK